MKSSLVLSQTLRTLFAVGLLLFTGVSSIRANEMDKLTDRVETCEAILREFQADPTLSIPAEILRQARGLVVVNQVKGGLVLGIQYGYGVVLARRADGTWSIPVLIKAGEASLGLQLGGQRAETIYIITDDATVRRLFDGRMNIGVDARAISGPRTYEKEKVNREILTTPVLVYNRNHGYYAGATVKTGWIDRNDSANWTLYSTPYVLPELLYADFVRPIPEVRPLMEFVTSITR